MAGLYRYVAYGEDGETLTSGSGNGSCTGMWCAGHNRLNQGRTMTLLQAFKCTRPMSSAALNQLANTRVLQSLVPGLSYAGHGGSFPEFMFPNVHELPSDQVITAMRMLKAFLGYQVDMNLLREYEFTMDELFPIALFYNQGLKSSDSRPLLAAASKAELVDHFTATPPSRHSWSHMSAELRRTPTAGAILPLIRGETRQGYQKSLITGYLKEGAMLMVMAKATPNPEYWDRRDEGFDLITGYDRSNLRDQEAWDAIPDDGSYSVNHPIVHFTEEAFSGPVLGRNNRATLDWLATTLGK